MEINLKELVQRLVEKEADQDLKTVKMNHALCLQHLVTLSEHLSSMVSNGMRVMEILILVKL